MRQLKTRRTVYEGHTRSTTMRLFKSKRTNIESTRRGSGEVRGV